MGQKKNSYRVLVEKSYGERPHGGHSVDGRLRLKFLSKK